VQLKYTDKEEHKEDDFMDPNKYAWYQSINYYI
jgi:hypothetical protein